MSSTTTPAAPGRPIPIPENFPVSWEDPADASLTWQLQPQIPFPVAPLIYSVLTSCVRGFSSVSAQIGLPFNLRTMRINGYYYVAFTPTTAPPEGDQCS